MISPNRKNRSKLKTQDGRGILRSKLYWIVERFFTWIKHKWRSTGWIGSSKANKARRTLTPEAMVRLEELVASSPVLENAFRLMSDASFLLIGKRFASAVALAVLSQEEIGKYLLNRWSQTPGFSYNKRHLHKAKQRAIAAIFMADSMRAEYLKRNVDFADLGSPGKMAVLVEAIREGQEKQAAYMSAATGGVIQHVKHSGLYYDEELAAKGIQPSKITAENADGLMRDCSKAFMILTEPKCVGIAGELYMIAFSASKKED